jgi:tetratricopeptide (TPR) repeat protein
VSEYRQEKYKDSVLAFERARTLKPKLLAPHLFMGMAYLKLGEPVKAVSSLKSALSIEPYQPDATLALGEALAQTHQFEASVRLLQEAFNHDPDSESVSSNLAVTYLEWAKDVGSKLRKTPSVYSRLLTDRVHAANDVESAEGAFRDTVAFAPDSLEARLALVGSMMEGQSTVEMLGAIEEQIEAAKKISPGNPAVAAEEVRLAITQHNIPRASGLLMALMTEDPAFTLANLDMLTAGLPAEDSQKVREQAISMEKCSSDAPNSFSSLFASLERMKSRHPLTAREDAEYASAAWHLHRYDEALSELVKRNRMDSANQYWLFNTCEALGKDLLERTVNAHPDSMRSHLLLADFAIQQNNFKAARSEYKSAMALRPHDPEIRLLNIRLLETEQEYQEAIEEAKLGAAEFPSDAGLSFEAGELMLRSGGDAAAAADYLEQALRVDSRLVRARVDLADAYASLQRLDDAIRAISQVIDTDDDGTLHYRLSRWYRQTGHPEEAAKALQACMRIKEQRLRKETSVSTEVSRRINP